MPLWCDIVFVFVAFASLIYLFFKFKFTYWSKHGIPHVTPSIPYGNIGEVGRKFHTTDLYELFYKEFKRKTPVMGFYAITAPQAMLLDLDVINRILIKDFHFFHDRAQYYNIEDDPLSAHLFNIDGEKWRILRTKLSPTFTSGKMKMMLPTVVAIADIFRDVLLKEIECEAEVEIKDYSSRFSADVIGSCAFGLECNSLMQQNTDFRKYGDKAFAMPWWRVIKLTFASSFVSLARKMHIKVLDSDVSNFYKTIVYETVKFREETGVQRNDFLNLLIQNRQRDGQNDKIAEHGRNLTLNEITAQCVIFFLAGFEASSSAMTFAMYEMAKHPGIQDKARKNVKQTLTKYGEKFTYEATLELTYLDQVINETMRKYPSIGSLTRRVTKDYQIPGTNYILKKDLTVIIPIHAIHNDPDIFPHPEKFDPNRFSQENMKNLHNAAFLPFGDGPRNCIGLRFGWLQMRIGLATILKSFRITTCSRTPKSLTIQKDTLLMSSEGGMWLKLERINDRI